MIESFIARWQKAPLLLEKSVVFPDGLYELNPDILQNPDDWRRSVTERIAPLVARVDGDSVAYTQIIAAVSEVAAGETLWMGNGPWAPGEQEQVASAVGFVESRIRRRFAAIQEEGYKLEDFLIIDGLLVPVQETHPFPYYGEDEVPILASLFSLLKKDAAVVESRVAEHTLPRDFSPREQGGYFPFLGEHYTSGATVFCAENSGTHLEYVLVDRPLVRHLKITQGDVALQLVSRPSMGGGYGIHQLYQSPCPSDRPRVIYHSTVGDWGGAFEPHRFDWQTREYNVLLIPHGIPTGGSDYGTTFSLVHGLRKLLFDVATEARVYQDVLSAVKGRRPDYLTPAKVEEK